MTFSKRSQSGFTLIELLVVVAIIGLLASIVTIALSSARDKGADAAIKNNMSGIRSQAELFFLNNNNSYLPAGGSVAGIQPCTFNYSATAGFMMGRDINIYNAIKEALKRGASGSSCYNSANGWAVAIGLKTSSGASSWCMDQTGAAKVVASAPSSAINTSTFLCN